MCNKSFIPINLLSDFPRNGKGVYAAIPCGCLQCEGHSERSKKNGKCSSCGKEMIGNLKIRTS